VFIVKEHGLLEDDNINVIVKPRKITRRRRKRNWRKKRMEKAPDGVFCVIKLIF